MKYTLGYKTDPKGYRFPTENNEQFILTNFVDYKISNKTQRTTLVQVRFSLMNYNMFCFKKDNRKAFDMKIFNI